jgi:hypothetical protein
MADTAEVLEFPSRQKDMTARPEAMVDLPDDNTKLVKTALDIIEVCRSDSAIRASYCRQLNMVIETGKKDGTRSLINLLYRVIDRLASHLFSPTDIRFSMDFENEYGPDILERGKVAARQMSRSWERTNTDLTFAMGVFESLKYGGAILKQWPSQSGKDKIPVFHSSLVMPWQFGVYRPDMVSLDSQPAMVETIMLTLPEVWRRIWHMPDARKLFDRIKQHAAPGSGQDVANNFFHQVLSTSPIQTGSQGAQRPVPGGIVQLSTDPNFTSIPPSTTAPLVRMHELWLWGREDYETIQIIEPDILIAPRYRRSNLLTGTSQSGLHPYTMIQPNQTHGNIWGRSELADLMEPQDFLSQTAMDIKRIFGVQVDKVLAFTGDGMTDELYDQARAAGYMNLGAGGDVKDLTPQFPGEALPLVDKIIAIMEMISGFDNMLSGRGETGVRSGTQSNPMMRAAGAPLKDRSLIVERQCAAAADLRFSLMQLKDGRTYWTDPKKPAETAFLLDDVPDDGRMVVDGHSSSAIFADEHQSLIIGGVKMGLVDPESGIEQLPFQNKDTLLARLRMKEEKQQAIMEDLHKHDPEAWARLLEKQSGRRR